MRITCFACGKSMRAKGSGLHRLPYAHPRRASPDEQRAHECRTPSVGGQLYWRAHPLGSVVGDIVRLAQHTVLAAQGDVPSERDREILMVCGHTAQVLADAARALAAHLPPGSNDFGEMASRLARECRDALD